MITAVLKQFLVKKICKKKKKGKVDAISNTLPGLNHSILAYPES